MTKCKCDLRTKLVGDGCRYCNPQDYIDHLHDAISEKIEWVGLTDEEIQEIALELPMDAVRIAEAVLRSKNT